jgi:hypothetical protein
VQAVDASSITLAPRAETLTKEEVSFKKPTKKKVRKVRKRDESDGVLKVEDLVPLDDLGAGPDHGSRRNGARVKRMLCASRLGGRRHSCLLCAMDLATWLGVTRLVFGRLQRRTLRWTWMLQRRLHRRQRSA